MKRSPAPTVAEHRVAVHGQAVDYGVAGTGEPVVLVHGLGGSSRCWTPALGQLAERYRVYLVDLPGFGTMRRLHRQFTVADAPGWLRAWMDAAGIGGTHLIGHSMGGYLAVRFAAEHPERVRRLVLVAPAGVPTGRSLLGHIVRLPRTLRYVTPAALALLAPDAVKTRPALVWRAARDLLAQDVRAQLSSIRVPTLVVWGRGDPLLPASLADAFAGGIEGCRLAVVDGAGHLPMLNRPAEFAREVLAFLHEGRGRSEALSPW